MHTTRVFLAAELDIKSRDLLSRAIKLLKNTAGGKKVRWLPAENLHLTIRFIGEIQKSQILTLSPLIQKTVRNLPPFRIELSTVSLFPSQHHPHVVVVDLAYSQTLQKLFADVEHAVVSAGFPEETRPARPHITIGRTKEKHIPPFDLDLTSTHTGFLVKEIVLFQTITLHERGVKYIPLEKYRLG